MFICPVGTSSFPAMLIRAVATRLLLGDKIMMKKKVCLKISLDLLGGLAHPIYRPTLSLVNQCGNIVCKAVCQEDTCQMTDK